MTVPAMGRVFPEGAYLALRAAFRRLTKSVGGQEAAARVTRADYQRIGRYGRANEALWAPVDIVADLEADAGEPIVTRILADMQGFVLVEKPAVEGGRQWVAELGALAKEAGDLTSGLAQALGDDGQVSAAEIADLDLRRDTRELLEVAARIDRALAVIENGENG